MATLSKKIIALFFLVSLTIQTFYPCTAYALTSGPAQPEMQKFESAGAADMVDLFSGDFKNNIPLMDVGGYPINISYQSGTGFEDEASWVGAGWTLNPGAVNRNMRGLPDDFDGSKGDKIDKEFSKKGFRKVGGTFNLKKSLFGWEFGSSNLKLSVYKDNYYGIGASLGASLGYNLSHNTQTPLTASLGISSDAREGVNLSPSLSIATTLSGLAEDDMLGISGGFQYNTRAGLKSTNLGATYKFAGSEVDNIELSAVKYYGQSHNPTSYTNTENSGFTFSFDGGPALFGFYGGIGGAGYIYKENILNKNSSVPAYGYLNYLKGQKDLNCLIDFNREKDGVYLNSTPSLPVPVVTNDFFTATSQTGSQQFRPYYGGNYLVFDQAHFNTTKNNNLGVTIGGGNIFKGGARLDFSTGDANTNKWVTGNSFATTAELPASVNPKPTDEAVYFKQVGEHNKIDQTFIDRFLQYKTAQVAIQGAGTLNALKTRENGNVFSTAHMKKVNREIRNYGFGILKGDQATKYALDKQIKNYSFNDAATYNSVSRVGNTRKPHHISEITVLDNEGKRLVYGVPVCNVIQQEITFAVNHPDGTSLDLARRTGLINYNSTDASVDNTNGRDNMYSKETTPAYATSYLLSGILSPDYVDLKGDGITDDDQGTAVKFNYSQLTDLEAATPVKYKWRAPYEQGKANYNEALMCDPKDDKASIVYGEKEIRYLNSIESKTMIAIFKTSDREDGMGVLGIDGGRNSALKLKKLDAVELYSKAEWLAKRGDPNNPPVPVKVVHFEYDYSTFWAVPNNSGVQMPGTDPHTGEAVDINMFTGKLTLRKIYFTFGSSSRGASNPYIFDYDNTLINDGANPFLPGPNTSAPFNEESLDSYTQHQADRWGTYKQSWYNQYASPYITSVGILNNSEYPYSLQKNRLPDGVTQSDWSGVIDHFASKWQLNKITTPTGSVISIQYESDDYAYVQNRKAMQMCFVKSINGISVNPIQVGMIDAAGFNVELPVAVSSSAEFREKYLNGNNPMNAYYKFYVDLNNQGRYEYVTGYAEIDPANCTRISSNIGRVAFKKIDGVCPVAKNAWQKIQTDLPQYAYDNYDNTEVGDFVGAIRSIIQAITNIKELVQSFSDRAKARNFGYRADLSKSLIRLNTPDGKKTGGGARVKKIEISDEWDNMQKAADPSSTAQKSVYGQEYNYTTKDNKGNTISSGVASYEPQIGAEENPFHEPVNFTEKVHWNSDKYHTIEKPYCESYFPAPGVGYSKVTVTSFGNNNAKETGYIENEFYTAKEFPTLVDNTQPDKQNYENSLILKLFSSISIIRASASQGFKVELNDMHGKPKSVKIFGKGGTPISSTNYEYNLKGDNQQAELKELDNNVDVLNSDGTYAKATVATDFDMITDIRESRNTNTGTSVGGYLGTTCYIFFCLPFGAIIPIPSTTTDDFHSVSAVKVINRFGVLKRVITKQNGSSITAENLMWDAVTGEVLLSKTQNEFNKYTYAFNYPAYMAYEGMGLSYKNLGATFTNLVSNADGVITSPLISSVIPPNEKLPSAFPYFFPGDELVALNNNKKVWVIKGPLYGPDNYNDLRLVDEAGEFVTTGGDYTILRSGRRNLLNAGAGSVILMNDPREGGMLNLGVDKKILDSKAVVYNEEWGIPIGTVNNNEAVVNDCNGEHLGHRPSSPAISASCTCVCLRAFFDYLISHHLLFIQKAQNITVGQLVAQINASHPGTPIEECEILTKNSSKLFYAITSDTEGLEYKAQIGGCVVSLKSNIGSPISFYDLESGFCDGNPVVNYNLNVPTQTFSKTFGVTCLQTNYLSVSPVLDQKIVTGHDGHGTYVDRCSFIFNGLSEIPFPAIIDNAHLFLYASPEGYNSVFGPYAHSAIAGDKFELRRVMVPNNCNEVMSSNTSTTSLIDNISVTSHFQNFELDVTSYVQKISNGTYDNAGLSIRCTPNSDGVSANVYMTFASQNHSIEAKRPKITVNYTVPAYIIANVATLAVEDCTAVTCQDPVGKIINPYYKGILGNWRPQTNYVYTVSREQKPGLPTQIGGTDIRTSGAYTAYIPLWNFNSYGLYTQIAPNTTYEVTDAKSRWVWNSKSIYYDEKGNETESVDPLNRYSSALFGYQTSVATAIAANARKNEIMFDGFEDYYFSLKEPSLPDQEEKCAAERHFDWNFSAIGKSTSGEIVSNVSHTGLYSYYLTGPVTINKPAGANAPTFPILDWDATGHYNLLANEQAAGFAPIDGKDYILSLWVKDQGNHPGSNKVTGLGVSINGQPFNLTDLMVPVVEGWKRLELKFTAAANFDLQLTPSGTVYIDDIRMFPYDAQLSSYVYSDQTMRLMAQLDENNFATFYEYDEEGTPIRVKKETERGVMTLKESRQAFQKH